MSDDHYFDTAAGAWRSKDDDAWLGERPEDDAPDAPEWRDREELPEPPKDDEPGKDPADDGPTHTDPMDDPEYRAAVRGQRELSGRVMSHGRRRGNHPTGRRGQGVRGLREGSYLADDLPPVQAPIRPTGRQLGPGAPATGSPSLSDAPELLARLLGSKRIALLGASFGKRGRPTAQENAARAYLAVILRELNATPVNRAAAELLLGASAERELRKIGDLRRGTYDPAVVATAEHELRAQLRPGVIRRAGSIGARRRRGWRNT